MEILHQFRKQRGIRQGAIIHQHNIGFVIDPGCVNRAKAGMDAGQRETGI
jgi:hypothetical protein